MTETTGWDGPCRFQAIVAMAANRVIGSANRIPWHLPEDFRWFKSKTLGHDLVMGRRTFESIGRPLPGRTTFVLSRGGFSHPGVQVIASLAELPSGLDRIRFICGGAEVYRMALPQCSDLFLTRVKREVSGDCLFPEFESLFTLDRLLRQGDDFDIEHYVRKAPAERVSRNAG